MAYDPRADDKQYVLTGMLDNIENGAIGTWDWIQKQAEDDPKRWNDDVLRLLGGGLKNTAWAISKIPLINKLAEGEDWLADQARKMNETLTPWLDPRVAGWGTRIGTGILADKGIRKATLLGKAKWGKYQMTKAFQKGSKFIPEEAVLPTLDSELGIQMMANIDDLSPNYISNFKPNASITNLGSRGFTGVIDEPNQIQRMSIAFDKNKKLIGKQNIDNTIGAQKQLSEVDKFAKVTKSKLRKYVEQYGGSAVDLEEIFKEYATKHASALNAKAWLNQYWKDLNKGVGKGGLRNARLKIVDGELKIVDGRTKKTIPHPFELDHSKAKELMYDLGLEGADMSDNLDIVYTEWNRAKNNIGNPAIPDDILEAVGQSTTLENFVRRRLDRSFMLAGERVPQRFKEAAKIRMMDAVQDMKPGEKLADIVETELKLWDEISDYMVRVDDYVTPSQQRILDAQTNLNPQEYLQQLKDLGVYNNLTKTLKNRYNKLAQEFRVLSQPSTVTTQRGYGANEASKWARFWSGRSD